MLSRIKRKFKRIFYKLFRKKNHFEIEAGTKKHFIIEDDRIIIEKEYLSDSLSLINEVLSEDDHLIPKRKITSMRWNGPIMTIEGYYYLENIPMNDEDVVKKRILLVDKKGRKFSVPISDVPLKTVGLENTIDEMYNWAGFKGEINFATFIPNNRPLPESEYKVYLELEVYVLGDKKYRKIFPFGNIESYLNEGFHSAKMEYFTAKREMKFNLMVTYDQAAKTLKINSTKLKDFNPKEMGLESHKYKKSFASRFHQSYGFRFFYKIYCLRPIKKNKVIFASDSRTELEGNFLFVYEEMKKRNLDLDYYFMLKNETGENKSLKEIKNLAYHLATSEFILLDDFYPMVYPLKIRKDAELIQLWHAVGAFKTFGFSRIGRPGGPSPKSLNHRNYTKAIVSSEHVAKYYAEGFGIDVEKVVATGIPRTDIFFDETYKENIKKKLYTEFPFLQGKKVITFAPTFRGNGQQSAYYPIEVLNLDKLYYELKDEYVFLFKIHPFVKNDFNIPYQYKDFFYDFSSYREINDLLFVTDLLITDYSSVCFEYGLLNKPMLFFAYDVEEYVQKRDFYYEYSSFIPGPLVKSTDDMIKTIKNEDFKMEKIKPFIEYFFDHHDGKSSERVVDQLILRQSKEENK
ncbi:CDP-glycerol glycerophosphotransferase family protein [Bacillus sp. FJAT-49732]|uniref:CDP-glycerol glycerophosphotransferase family protein n=1 Tax=Lederbergia citrisecunda TaxID=2833583 RepID=A0A942TLV4_9BACI|nr:CDP-glycerol glycerophosphotransferase family protein [Lederbergia citrisecunda]MBS4200651.1 CDP-glycerol glycerophosphotransferase family protein [Lederbergia citrisecunda]